MSIVDGQTTWDWSGTAGRTAGRRGGCMYACRPRHVAPVPRQAQFVFAGRWDSAAVAAARRWCGAKWSLDITVTLMTYAPSWPPDSQLTIESRPVSPGRNVTKRPRWKRPLGKHVSGKNVKCTMSPGHSVSPSTLSLSVVCCLLSVAARSRNSVNICKFNCNIFQA